MTATASIPCRAKPKTKRRSGTPVNREMPNAETRAILDRDMDGKEPSYGPFASAREMLDFIEAMPD
jgi:hypothetical protein